MDPELSCRWDELLNTVRQWSWGEASGRVPDTAEHRAHLRRLDLSTKRLDRLPEGVTACTNLRWLDLSYNSLAHLPADLTALSSLRVLEASGNSPSSIAPDLVELQQLDTVRLDWERLSREVGTTQVPSEVVAFLIKRTDRFVGDEVLWRILGRCESFAVCLAMREHVNRTVTSWSDRKRLLQEIEAVQREVPQGDGSLSLATEEQGGLTVSQPEGHLSMHAGNGD